MTTVEVSHLTKRFGAVAAVDDLTFTVRPGRITGFLGPNGAGKTTALRVLLGLVAPDAGAATFDGARYRDLPVPIRTVGAVLDDAGAHPGRSARSHLRAVATAAGTDRRRVDHLLELVGLTTDADRRVGGYSLGMRRRLALATALLGEPSVLVLDEPTNGLDPAGVHWLRALLRELAGEGRTVLVSSHLLAEMANTVDDVVIIDHGRLLRSGPLADIAGPAGVTVTTPEGPALRDALVRAGIASEQHGHAVLARDTTPEVVGRIVAAAGLVVHDLRRTDSTLEDAFLELTSKEHR